MADIVLWKVERGRVKGSLTKLKNFSENIPADKTVEDVQARLERLEELQREFKLVDDRLVVNDVESEYSSFEDKYLDAKAALKRHLNKLKVTDKDTTQGDQLNTTMSRIVEQQQALFDSFSSHPTPSNEVNLPRVDIPSFSGDYKDWPSFKDLFVSSIDKKENLPAVHKLQYLKGLLKGEAAALVKHLPITEANYCEAWSKLVKRCDKKRQIISAYIKAFVAQPSLSQPSGVSLRRLVDTSDQLIRGINVLGQNASSRDPWLIYLILNKTDSDTRKAWAEETADEDFPSFDKFIEFLNKRCDALETFDSAIKKQPGNYVVRNLHLDTSQRCVKCSQVHQLFKCPEYKMMDVVARRAFVGKNSLCFNCLNPGHPALKCKSKVRCHYCKQLHHSSLHSSGPRGSPSHSQPSTSQEADLSHQPHASNSSIRNLNTSTPSFNPSTSYSGTGISASNANSATSHINAYTVFEDVQAKLTMLPTAIVNVADEHGTLHLCRALLDSGSQASFISEDCAKRLRLKRDKARVIVRGLSSTQAAITRGVLSLLVSSRFLPQHQLRVQAYIVNKLSAPQPSRTFTVTDWSLLKKYNLADPQFNVSRSIDIILGAEHFNEILQDGRIKVLPSFPLLKNTLFGYIIAGSLAVHEGLQSINSLHADVSDIDSSLRRFWEVEELPNQSPKYTSDEERCESLFDSNHYVDPTTNRYVVQLPFKENAPSLGNSLHIAFSRLNSLEKRLQQDSSLHKAYSDFMLEYRDLQHLEPIPVSALNLDVEHAYLPHHPVIKPTSTTTKIRVVFNGSQPSSTGCSLNQKLLVGPKVQRDLLPILLSFRAFKVAVVADIEKMYRQILVHKDDRHYQRILWRMHPSEPIKHFWLTTVTYGTSAAPFLATRALKQLTIEFQGQYPLAEEALKNNFYVDDLMGGAKDEQEALLLYSQLTNLLQLRGFTLRKWASNSTKFLNSISGDKCEISSMKIDENPESLKVLGLKWTPSMDCFTFDVSLPRSSNPTKRNILSESSRIFDPLGLVSPVTISFKILLQHLWLKRYDWDENCKEFAETWNKMRNDLIRLQELRIPRWIPTSASTIELHGFADASEAAYAAVIYSRTATEDGTVRIDLVAAKTRVSPIKQISIPRLELCGATLLTKLMEFTKSTMNIPEQRCFAWTDSTVVLSWLSSHPRKWQCFVGNRTSLILSVLPRTQWHHVSSGENPADLASRGLLARELVKSTLWWQGPSWLMSNWRETIHFGSSTEVETEAVANVEKRERYLCVYHSELENENELLTSLFTNRSSLTQILRILGRCFQFVRNCKTSIKSNRTSWITTSDMNSALRGCILWVQGGSFSREIKALQTQQPLHSSSPLLRLTPFLDNDNILRLGGRLDHSSYHYDTKHPILLPKDHSFVKYLIAQLHEKYLHAGTTLLLSIVRQKYWIMGCRIQIKAHINKCLTCVRHRAATSQQLMASLPKHRVGAYRPFENVGVDYAGPFTLLFRKGRGAHTTKGYIVLFVCFSTRAMHLELAGDMTSDTFIACLKRFVSRRGIPANVYSDNGTNFVGANRQLEVVRKSFNSFYKNSSFSNFVSSNSISWSFNPPSAPHFGGIWEAGVRCVKTLLRKTIGDTKLTYEEMNTLLAQIEGLLNSRPLLPITDDISSVAALTPAHFLIGQPFTTLPEIPVNPNATSLQGRWRLLQRMHQHFWKRWHLEYITTLQQRPKWYKTEPNLSIGDLVIIKENNLPPAKWALGRVSNTYPGSDGLVRVVDVKTAYGELKRPAVKLCKLPISIS